MSSPPPAAGIDWRPAAGLEALRRRAGMAAAVRAFFAERGVLEVETPILSAETTPEAHLASLTAEDPESGRRYFLQTSPELPMKRLLAAGSGPIYQLARVARGGERGRRHNPEFTLLEWYRPAWDHHRLMDEVEELVRRVAPRRMAMGRSGRSRGGDEGVPRWTYRHLFQHHLDLDPHTARREALDAAMERAGIRAPELPYDDHDARLHLLLTHAIEPRLPDGPLFVHDFPASQASLARTRRDADGVEVAERFELYLGGVELANGFHELLDPVEQRRRFAAEGRYRRRAGLPEVPQPERFLAALESGLPASAGVALGFDRLVMLELGAESLDAVLAFPEERA